MFVNVFGFINVFESNNNICNLCYFCRLRTYFAFLYLNAILFMNQLLLLQFHIENENQSPFERNAPFMFITIVSVFISSLATMILRISTMKEIHYTILKTIGSFSAFLAPLSLAMVLYVPPDFNWIGCLLIYLTVKIFEAFYSKFRDMSILDRGNDDDFFCIYYIGLLVPLNLVLVLSVPENLNWIVYSVHKMFFGIVFVYYGIIGLTMWDSELYENPPS